MDTEKKVHVEYSLCEGGYRLYFTERTNGDRYVGELTFKKVNDYEYIKPTIILSETEAKSFASQLSRLGFVQSDDAGELAATKRHLEDMRYLAKVKKVDK
jgi:hypothetical protein